MRSAIENADREARRQPASAGAAGNLALVYHANQFFEQARAAYRIAARLAPGDAQWAYGHAVLEEESGDEKEQTKLLQRTLEIQADHVPALVKLADLSFKTDRLDEAAACYERAAKVPGGYMNLQAAFGRGRVAARRGDWSWIVEVITPMTRSWPHAAPLYDLLGQAHEALKQSGKAAEAKQSAATAKWRSVPPLDDFFQERLMEVCWSSTRLLKHAGLMSRMGLADRALAAGRRAAQADPQDADVRHFLARTLLTFYADRPDAAAEGLGHIEECLRIRPNDPIPLGGFADEFFKSPKAPEAVARLRKLLLAHPGIPGVHFFLGMAADELGETDEAVAEYRAALRDNPKQSAVYNRLGLLAERTGKPAEALANFQMAIQLNPLNSAARSNLAIALMQRGEHAAGLRQLTELLRADPHDAAAHVLSGFALLSLRRPDEAAARFRQGLVYQPEDAGAHFGLATALAAQGKRAEAAAEAREALRLRPDYPEARQLLSQLEP